MLNAHPIEEELEIVANDFDRAKIEQLDKEMSAMLLKARSKAEGEKEGYSEVQKIPKQEDLCCTGICG